MKTQITPAEDYTNAQAASDAGATSVVWLALIGIIAAGTGNRNRELPFAPFGTPAANFFLEPRPRISGLRAAQGPSNSAHWKIRERLKKSLDASRRNQLKGVSRGKI